MIVFAKCPLPSFQLIFQSQQKYNLLNKDLSHPSGHAESVKNSFLLQCSPHQSQSSLVEYKLSSRAETRSLIFLMFSTRPGIYICFIVLAGLRSIRSDDVMPSASSIRKWELSVITNRASLLVTEVFIPPMLSKPHHWFLVCGRKGVASTDMPHTVSKTSLPPQPDDIPRRLVRISCCHLPGRPLHHIQNTYNHRSLREDSLTVLIQQSVLSGFNRTQRLGLFS